MSAAHSLGGRRSVPGAESSWSGRHYRRQAGAISVSEGDELGEAPEAVTAPWLLPCALLPLEEDCGGVRYDVRTATATAPDPCCHVLNHINADELIVAFPAALARA